MLHLRSIPELGQGGSGSTGVRMLLCTPLAAPAQETQLLSQAIPSKEPVSLGEVVVTLLGTECCRMGSLLCETAPCDLACGSALSQGTEAGTSGLTPPCLPCPAVSPGQPAFNTPWLRAELGACHVPPESAGNIAQMRLVHGERNFISMP